MYAKYGSIKTVRVWHDALWINNFMDCNDYKVWKEAIKVFQQIEYGSINPYYVIFVSILYTCSYAGLIKGDINTFNMIIIILIPQ